MCPTNEHIFKVVFAPDGALKPCVYLTNPFNYYSRSSNMMYVWTGSNSTDMSMQVNRDFCEVACWICEQPLSAHIAPRGRKNMMTSQDEYKCPFSPTKFKQYPSP